MSQRIALREFKSSNDFYNQQVLQKITKLIMDTTQQLANKYKVSLNKVVVKYNRRYRKTLGEYKDYFQNTISGICEFTFNEKFVLGCFYDPNNGINSLLQVVKHEALHYIAQFIHGGKNDDGTNNFEQLLKENNAISSGATNSQQRLSNTVCFNYTFQNNVLFKIIY